MRSSLLKKIQTWQYRYITSNSSSTSKLNQSKENDKPNNSHTVLPKTLFHDENNGGCHPDNFEERVERNVWKKHNVNNGYLGNEEDEIVRQLIEEHKPDYKPPQWTED